MNYQDVVNSFLLPESDKRWGVILVVHMMLVYEKGFEPDVSGLGPKMVDGSLYVPVVQETLLTRMRNRYSPESDGPSMALMYYTIRESNTSITLSWTAFETDSLLCQIVRNEGLKPIASWSKRVGEWFETVDEAFPSQTALKTLRDLCKSISQNNQEPQVINESLARDRSCQDHHYHEHHRRHGPGVGEPRRQFIVPGDPGYRHPPFLGPLIPDPELPQLPPDLVGPDHPMFRSRRNYFYPEGP